MEQTEGAVSEALSDCPRNCSPTRSSLGILQIDEAFLSFRNFNMVPCFGRDPQIVVPCFGNEPMPTSLGISLGGLSPWTSEVLTHESRTEGYAFQILPQLQRCQEQVFDPSHIEMK